MFQKAAFKPAHKSKRTITLTAKLAVLHFYKISCKYLNSRVQRYKRNAFRMAVKKQVSLFVSKEN